MGPRHGSAGRRDHAHRVRRGGRDPRGHRRRLCGRGRGGTPRRTARRDRGAFRRRARHEGRCANVALRPRGGRRLPGNAPRLARRLVVPAGHRPRGRLPRPGARSVHPYGGDGRRPAGGRHVGAGALRRALEPFGVAVRAHGRAAAPGPGTGGGGERVLAAGARHRARTPAGRAGPGHRGVRMVAARARGAHCEVPPLDAPGFPGRLPAPACLRRPLPRRAQLRGRGGTGPRR